MFNDWFKIRVGFAVTIMFILLILLTFLTPAKAETLKETKQYFRFYNMGRAVAKADYKEGKLWKRYAHKMKESKKERAFREGYLDFGAYYAMPLVKKIAWDLKYSDWRETK